MPRRLALIIGNSEYEDSSLSALVTPGADVNALAGVLRNPEVGGFDEVTALVNQSASVIQRAIAGFFAEREREDLLLLYFSGHGVRDERGQLFLAARDTEHRLLRGTAIPSSFITEEMDSSRSRRQVLILDCCHSGAFSRGMKGTAGGSVGTAVAFEGTGSGRVVLTATDSTQYAWEGDRVIGQAENSVFTHHLIEGLRTGAADTDSDGRITLDELYDYVYDLVVNETPRQTPSKWSYGQQGEIVLARNPRPVVKPAELPADLQETIEDPRPWVRESSLRELDRIMRGTHRGLALAARQAIEMLTEDDSRRVAAAAAQALAAFPEVSPVVSPESEPPSAPSESRMLFKEMSGIEPRIERTAEIKEEVNDRPMEPRLTAPPVRMPASQGLRSVRSAGLPWLRGLAAGGGVLMRSPALVAAAGWAVGGALEIYWGWTRNPTWGFTGFSVIVAVTLALLIWYWQRSFNWTRIALIFAACWAGSYIWDQIDAPVADSVSYVFGHILSADLIWKVGWWTGLALGGLLTGSLLGGAILLALRGPGTSLTRRASWVLAAGWSLGFTILGVIGQASGELTNWDSLRAVVLGFGLGGLIGGAVGSLIMRSQLAKAGEAERPLSPAPST